jgi:hypothetical protein
VDDWAGSKARLWTRFTLLLLCTCLLVTSLLAFGLLSPDAAFALVWALALALILVYAANLTVGDVARKLFLLLETDEERMEFFLQVGEKGTCVQHNTTRITYVY